MPQFRIENPEIGDRPGLAGNAVDLDGDLMIVGALRTDPFNVTDAGAAYAFDLHAVLTQRLRDVLLGRSNDGEGLDLNDDGRIDIADLILSLLSWRIIMDT